MEVSAGRRTRWAMWHEHSGGDRDDADGDVDAAEELVDDGDGETHCVQ